MARPLWPEPKFFLSERGSYQDYLARHFANAPATTLFGEKSTSYCEIPAAAQRIRALIPQCRILFLLRDPVERALSNYFFSYENGLETRSLEDVFLLARPAPVYDPMRVSVNPFHYLERGRYAEFIGTYLAVFGSQRIGVFFLEELPAQIRSVYSFVGADPDFVPSFPRNSINSAQRSNRCQSLCAGSWQRFSRT